MYKLAIAVGILAGLVQLAGYWMYNRRLARKEINPNATTWAIWGLGSFIACALYSDLAKDWVKEFLPCVCAVAALLTFAHMMARGSFQKPDRVDVDLFILDVAVVAYWMDSGNPFTSNVLLMIDIWISFMPIFRSTWKNPHTEDPKPWMVWSIAYALLIITVILRWEKWWDLLLPANYLILHAAIWAISRFKTAKS